MSVAILKRATPRMKYHHMNHVLDFRRQLADHQDKVILLKDEFGYVLGKLKANDPNWERWYDDEKNIPERLTWNESDIKPILYRMETRILHKMIRDELPINLVAKTRTEVL